jgi:hypothetical protein
MTSTHFQDLVIVVADKNMEAAMRGILSRNHSLGIREVSYKILPHMHRDSGCRLGGHSLLKSFITRCTYAIVMFDREGCGRENLMREELETLVENNLADSGWADRSIALVLDPELEAWVWKDSRHVEVALGWDGKQPNLYTWLHDHGYINDEVQIPQRPKEAMEAVLKVVHKPRSSSTYLKLAQTVGLRHCNNPTFLKLKATLQQWFPQGNE